MRRQNRRGPWLAGLTAVIALATLPAQGNAQSSMPGTIPGMGSMSSSSLKPINYGGATGQEGAVVCPDYESVVSFIDSAIPMNQVKLRFDANYDNHRPTRAEYLFPKSGMPGDPGWWFPEKSVDHQELVSYIEIAYQGMLSAFIELPTRWVNPVVNPNEWGMTDIQGGIKVAFLSTPGFQSAFEVRGAFPTRTGPGLSNMHYSVEPGLLFFLRPAEWIVVEGEARYWVPLCGTDYAGDLVRYGLGVSFGQRNYNKEWITPVLEVIGWTPVGGQEMVPMPNGPIVRGASGATIVNAIGGLRFGFGDHGDIYAGYGRAVTGDAWQDQFWRLEFRVKF